MIAVAGAAGFGVVWGWLAGVPPSRGRRAWIAAAALFTATSALAIETFLLAGGSAAAAIVAAAAVGAALRAGWRSRLARASRRLERPA